MENYLVQVKENETVTTSLLVAESFGKRHDNVLRAIDNLVEEIGLLKFEETPLLFQKSNYENEQNGQTYQLYHMNRDGFTLLTMGFSGKKALAWKLKYIQAFNEMERRLHSEAITVRESRLEIAKILAKTSKTGAEAIVRLYPEYFTTQPGTSLLEHISDANTSYSRWMEDYNISADWIEDFPTSDIYNNYVRYCMENRLTIMGKKIFYSTLENDFGFTRKQKADGHRYFIMA